MLNKRHLAPMLLLIGSAFLVLAACTPPTLAPTRLPPSVAPTATRGPGQIAQSGHELFVKWRCIGCHGEQAQGLIGPRLAQTALTMDQFTLAVRQTRPPKPAFAESILPAGDVSDIYAYVRGLEVPLATLSAAATSGAATEELLGMSVYTSNRCDSCHGPFAQGGKDVPALINYGKTATVFLDAMNKTTDKIKEHKAATSDPGLMRRLYQWLSTGADPAGGC